MVSFLPPSGVLMFGVVVASVAAMARAAGVRSGRLLRDEIAGCSGSVTRKVFRSVS